MVVLSWKIEMEQGKKAKQFLVSANTPFLGVVLNNSKVREEITTIIMGMRKSYLKLNQWSA